MSSNSYPILSQVVLPEGDVESDVVMAGDILEPNLSSNPSSKMVPGTSKMMPGTSKMVAVASKSNLLEPATSNQLDLSGNHSSEEEVNFSSINTVVILVSFSFEIIGIIVTIIFMIIPALS